MKSQKENSSIMKEIKDYEKRIKDLRLSLIDGKVVERVIYISEDQSMDIDSVVEEVVDFGIYGELEDGYSIPVKVVITLSRVKDD